MEAEVEMQVEVACEGEKLEEGQVHGLAQVQVVVVVEVEVAGVGKELEGG